MRVLLVSAAYPPDRCGVGDYSHRLARQLTARRRLEMAVLTAAPGAVQDAASPLLLRAAGGTIRAADIWRAVRGFRPDLVHLQYPTRRLTHPLAGFLARRILGVPVVETWHEHVIQWHWSDWLRTPALDGLMHVRPDLLENLHPRIRRLLREKPTRFIAGERTIPAAALSEAARQAAKQQIAGGAPLVAFFGFIHPNKGVHLLFEIADPSRHHLLLIGELDSHDEYQRHIAELVDGPRWRGRAKAAGFVDAEEAGRLLAIADAVVFPFPGGIGHWNSSVNTALASGSLVIATTGDSGQVGYHAGRNLYLAAPGDVAAMRAAVDSHLGARRPPDASDNWDRIAEAHERFYEQLG
jgi:glycosyltransferase involved in cell wall biosynthesis